MFNEMVGYDSRYRISSPRYAMEGSTSEGGPSPPPHPAAERARQHALRVLAANDGKFKIFVVLRLKVELTVLQSTTMSKNSLSSLSTMSRLMILDSALNQVLMSATIVAIAS